MKLISCYIEGFGEIQKRDYVFADGITCFCEANGSGKSTLAAFIKAMFYGMDPIRKNSKDFTDRLHYYPFEGGAFGGNLVFEMQGDTYKIERFFDEKSAAQDGLTVYKNAELYGGFGEDIGKGVFGIDKASFEHTAFVDAGEIEIASTSGINAKLNAFVQGAEEGSLDGALTALDEEAKRYKKKNSNDLISTTTNEIRRLEAEIRNLTTVQNGLAAKHERLRTIETELREVEDKLKRYNETALVLKDWEAYETGLSHIQELGEQLADLKARYPLGMPEEEELAAICKVLEEDAACRTEASVATLSEGEKEKLAHYRVLFADGVLTREALDRLGETVKREGVLAHDVATRERVTLGEESRALIARFDGKAPSEEALQKVEALAKEYSETEQLYRGTPAQLGAAEEKTAKKPRSFKLPAVLAGVLLIGGIALLFVNTAVGIALTALGAVGLLVIAFLYLNHKVSQETAHHYENPQKALLLSRLTSIEDQLKAFLIPLGFFSGRGILVDLANLQNDLSAYRRLASERAENERELKTMREEQAALRGELTACLARYGLTYGGDDGALQKLRTAVSDYETLSRRHDGEEKRLRTVAERREAYAQTLKAFGTRYGFDSIDTALLDRVKNDKAEILRLEKEIALGQTRSEAFFTEKKLTEKPDPQPMEVNAVTASGEFLRTAMVNLTREIEDDERRVEELDSYLRECDEQKAALRDYQNRHKLLSAAKDFLMLADKTLKERYVKPVKDEFLKHAAVIETTLGERVVMDHNYQIRFERAGKERSDRHLSSGQRSICAFAFRLALLMQMYPGEKPFLILDDPFTSLDATHFEKVAEVVREISKTSQILYFTCHESRKL